MGEGMCIFIYIREEYVLTVTVRKNETVDKAIRRLKKKVDREGVLKIVRQHQQYEKPSEKKLRKQKAARRNAHRLMKLYR
jgi:small subunit ribosomal protein S21